jgi:hypothetical protein
MAVAAVHRFKAGQSGELNGIEWRIVPGKKKPGDLRLDLRAREFRAVPMSLSFLLADFHFQVEHHLYAPGDGFLGGEKFMRGVNGSVVIGWEAAVEWLENERARKRAA